MKGFGFDSQNYNIFAKNSNVLDTFFIFAENIDFQQGMHYAQILKCT